MRAVAKVCEFHGMSAVAKVCELQRSLATQSLLSLSLSLSLSRRSCNCVAVSLSLSLSSPHSPPSRYLSPSHSHPLSLSPSLLSQSVYFNHMRTTVRYHLSYRTHMRRTSMEEENALFNQNPFNSIICAQQSDIIWVILRIWEGLLWRKRMTNLIKIRSFQSYAHNSQISSQLCHAYKKDFYRGRERLI